MTDVLRVTGLTKTYGGRRGTVTVRALDGLSMTVEKGEFVGIMGPSGSGKTTLLHLLGTIDRPTSGHIILEGQELSDLKGLDLAVFRRRRLGFIFQEFNLLDSLTIKENIILPLALEKKPASEIESRTAELARELGILEVLSRYPYEVSGGQKQRAAAARALMAAPALVLADEPTGNLDTAAARSLMGCLEDLNVRKEATILMVTHDPVSASYCRRILFIKDGRIHAELRRGLDRGQFLQRILDTIAVSGGGCRDLATSGR